MTVESFIHDMEGYYNDGYGEVGRRLMGQYLEKVDDELLPFLFAQVIKTYERTKGRISPGVAELEKCKKEAWGKLEKHQSRARALAAPDRPLIGEDILAPEKVADVLGALAASKNIDIP